MNISYNIPSVFNNTARIELITLDTLRNSCEQINNNIFWTIGLLIMFNSIILFSYFKYPNNREWIIDEFHNILIGNISILLIIIITRFST